MFGAEFFHSMPGLSRQAKANAKKKKDNSGKFAAVGASLDAVDALDFVDLSAEIFDDLPSDLYQDLNEFRVIHDDGDEEDVDLDVDEVLEEPDART